MKLQTTAEVKICAQAIHQTIGKIDYPNYFTPILREDIKLHQLQDLMAQAFGARNFHELHKQTNKHGLQSICDLGKDEIKALKSKIINLLSKLLYSLQGSNKNEAVFLSHALTNTLFHDLGLLKHKSGFLSLSSVAKNFNINKSELITVLNSKKSPKFKNIPSISCLSSGLSYAKFYSGGKYDNSDCEFKLFTVWDKNKIGKILKAQGINPFDSFWKANTCNKVFLSLKRIANDLGETAAITKENAEDMYFSVDIFDMHVYDYDEMWSMTTHCLNGYMYHLNSVHETHDLYADSQKLLSFLMTR